jgi:uncharacterized cupredoxin-like copper-binding protein
MIGRAAMLFAALLPAHVAAAADWSRARTVDVVAIEYRFEPNRLVFDVGVRYRLHLVDRGKEIHDFTAPEFFKTVALRNPGAMNEAHTGIAVRPGEAKDLYFVPRRAGHYPFGCADHDWAGMTGEITVQ